jgi:hypothetical protein
LQIAFVEDAFIERIRRAVVPARIVVMVEAYGDDHARTDIRAAPAFVAAVEDRAYSEFAMLHFA